MRRTGPKATVRLWSSFCTLLAAGANVNEDPSTALQLAAEGRGNLDVMEVLLKPLEVIQIRIEKARALPFKTSYTRMLISGTEKAQTVTVQNTANPNWDEILYLPLCYTTNEIAVEVIGQDSLGRDRSIFSNVTPTRNFVKEADGVFIMNERWLQTHAGPADCSISTAISLYPCLASTHMPKQEEDDVSLKSDASFESALEFMPLTSLDDPILSLDELVKCDTGFIMFKLLSLSALTQSSVSAQLQILVDDMLFPSYSSTVARKRGQIKKIGHCFIRELEFSQITFRLKKEGDQFDESTEGVLAKLSANTPDILKYCLSLSKGNRFR